MASKFKIAHIGKLLKETYNRWTKTDPYRQSVVIAYYAIFSLPGLLVIIINTAGFFFGEEAVQGEISKQVGQMIGSDAGKAVENLVAQATVDDGSVWATVIGIATIIFGATGVFYQLQLALNNTWGIKPIPQKEILKYIRDRFFSFGLILAIGFLLLISLVISAVLTVLNNWIKDHLPDFTIYIFRFINFIISFGIVTLLFSVMFKALPDAKIRWRDVWVGGAVTALLFALGKEALSLYFGKGDPASVYGAAGYLILILLWFTYSGLILFFGAEFTYVYAKTYGKKIKPSDFAVSTEDENKADTANEIGAARIKKIKS